MLYVVQLVPYEGEDTALCVEGGDTLFCIVEVTEQGAAVLDHGYRTIEEALHAWPEAKPPPASAVVAPRERLL